MVYIQAEWQNLQLVTVVLKMAFELEFKRGGYGYLKLNSVQNNSTVLSTCKPSWPSRRWDSFFLYSCTAFAHILLRSCFSCFYFAYVIFTVSWGNGQQAWWTTLEWVKWANCQHRGWKGPSQWHSYPFSTHSAGAVQCCTTAQRGQEQERGEKDGAQRVMLKGFFAWSTDKRQARSATEFLPIDSIVIQWYAGVCRRKYFSIFHSWMGFLCSLFCLSGSQDLLMRLEPIA